jgi:hypothetical protein
MRRTIEDWSRILPGGMARSGAIGGAAVPGNADDADVEAIRRGEIDMRQAVEGGDAAEARGDEARQRLIELSAVWHDDVPSGGRAL